VGEEGPLIPVSNVLILKSFLKYEKRGSKDQNVSLMRISFLVLKMYLVMSMMGTINAQ